MNIEPFLDSFMVTLEIAFLSAFFGALLGVPAALALTRWKHPLANLDHDLPAVAAVDAVQSCSGSRCCSYLSAVGLRRLVPLAADRPYGGEPALRGAHSGRRVSGACPRISRRALWFSARAMAGVPVRHLADDPAWDFRGVSVRDPVFVDNLPISFFFASPATSTLPVVMLSYLENSFDPSIAAVSTVQLVFALIFLLVIERFYGLKGMAPAS